MYIPARTAKPLIPRMCMICMYVTECLSEERWFSPSCVSIASMQRGGAEATISERNTSCWERSLRENLRVCVSHFKHSRWANREKKRAWRVGDENPFMLKEVQIKKRQREGTENCWAPKEILKVPGGKVIVDFFLKRVGGDGRGGKQVNEADMIRDEDWGDESTGRRQGKRQQMKMER